ncbi:MFS transporter [Rhizobium sp. BR 362]|uniref:MFS transporter n=1 Tax=Rhizobium sp. BR 362 TaxID=3040670 RepID=UPI002F415C2C
MKMQSHSPMQTAAAEFAMILGAFVLGTSEFVSMGLLPEMANTTGVPVAVAGDYITAYAVGVVVGAPLIAALAARVPRNTLLIGLLLLCVIGNALSGIAANFGLVLTARFLSGLPQGAFFGVAALVAAMLAGPHKRTQAIARIMTGLSIANLVGAPIGTYIGEHTTWHVTYLVLAILAALAALICSIAVPAIPASHGASPLRELSALTKPQVWLTFAIGAVGLAGLFSLYTFLVPILEDITGMSKTSVPIVLAIVGLGMFVGNFFGGWLADKGVMRAIGVILLFNLVVLMSFFFSVHSHVVVCVSVFFAGFTSLALVPPLQARLMDVAGHAQALGAMLNGCAINLANAVGAVMGAMAIGSNLGPASTGLVGAAMSGAGFIVFAISLATERRAAVA